ncbi:unnamed protein product [Adineta ricciae]|uniref:Uncharacterized protein n=1 Tax=Adineta ricciae TaxID=249248 RepID=A0A815K1H0_ADIRI|nr:unnamed protein product [Adineta ricciae]CAF1437214.1 unnamed protein product [Adineta ricciae]
MFSASSAPGITHQSVPSVQISLTAQSNIAAGRNISNSNAGHVSVGLVKKRDSSKISDRKNINHRRVVMDQTNSSTQKTINSNSGHVSIGRIKRENPSSALNSDNINSENTSIFSKIEQKLDLARTGNGMRSMPTYSTRPLSSQDVSLIHIPDYRDSTSSFGITNQKSISSNKDFKDTNVIRGLTRRINNEADLSLHKSGRAGRSYTQSNRKWIDFRSSRVSSGLGQVWESNKAEDYENNRRRLAGCGYFRPCLCCCCCALLLGALLATILGVLLGFKSPPGTSTPTISTTTVTGTTDTTSITTTTITNMTTDVTQTTNTDTVPILSNTTNIGTDASTAGTDTIASSTNKTTSSTNVTTATETTTTATTTTSETTTSATTITATTVTTTSTVTTTATTTSITTKTTSTTSTTTTETKSTTTTTTTTTSKTTSTTSKTTTTTTTSATTTTTTTTTTTMTVCSGAGLGALLSRDTPVSWTQFSFTYVATQTAPIVQFAFNNGGTNTYLDGISIVDTATPGTQLLTNPSFESSTSVPPTGWVAWCTYTCDTGTSGQIVTNSSACQPNSGNHCFWNRCTHGYEFIGQKFTAVVGHTYNVSFWLEITAGSTSQFYADIT